MEIVYFDISNQYAGTTYPASQPFFAWLRDDTCLQFMDELWVVDNEICVIAYPIDEYMGFRVSAPLDWVETNCPSLLNTEFYTTEYNDKFLEYKEDNFGVIWRD